MLAGRGRGRRAPRQPWCAGLELLAHRIAERWRERAERLAGLALILLGSYLVPEQATR